MGEELQKRYKRIDNKRRLILLSLLIVDILLIIVCLCVGSANLSLSQILQGFFNTGEHKYYLIVWKIRMPRVIAAVLAGGGLAISGLIMQSVLKNPMASPSTLGVSNAAVFGANFAIIVLGMGAFNSSAESDLFVNNPYFVATTALIFAVISVGLILILSHIKRFSSEIVVLAGLAVGAIFTAGTTMVQFFADSNQLSSAVFWSFGNLARATFLEDLIMFIVIATSFIFFMFNRLNYDAMTAGLDTARTMGVNTKSLSILSLLFASLITATCVSFLGIIGFIGLIAPHIIKRFIGDNHRFLIPASFLSGVAILLIADTISRTIVSGLSLPVGAITSLLGGPMFIYLLIRGKQKNA